MRSTAYGEEHEAFRQVIREFLVNEVVPHFPEWERAGLVPKEVCREAGKIGMLGLQVPEEYGGGGTSSFKFNAIITEETARDGVSLGGLSVHLNVVLSYFLAYATEKQKQRWLPGLRSEEHTSELQSREKLVCRLLLEKK